MLATLPGKERVRDIYAWCIMPSHVHMIISSHDKPLEDIVRDMKSYSSTQLRKLIKEHPQESRREWMQWMFERAGKKNCNNSGWSRKLSGATAQSANRNCNKKMYEEIVWYIYQNPFVGGFVYEPEQWIYSSPKGYAKNDGIIKLAEY